MILLRIYMNANIMNLLRFHRIKCKHFYGMERLRVFFKSFRYADLQPKLTFLWTTFVLILGDMLISVNGSSLVNLTNHEAATILSSCGPDPT